MLSLLLQAAGQFTPFDPGAAAQEALPATPLIYTAYAIVWLVLIAYVFSIWTRRNKVESELKDVAAKIKAR